MPWRFGAVLVVWLTVASGAAAASVWRPPAVVAGPLRMDVRPDTGRVRIHVSGGPTVTVALGVRTPDGSVLGRRVVSSTRRRTLVSLVLRLRQGTRLQIQARPRADGVIEIEERIAGSLVGVSGLGAWFGLSAHEHLLGFGERSDAIDQRGRTVESYVSDGPYQPDEFDLVSHFIPASGIRGRSDATYFPIPWLLSSRGYGVLADTSATTYHRLGSERRDAWSIEATFSPRGTPPTAPPRVLRLRIYAGPTPADVLRRFTEDVGRQPRPVAPWVFGPWFQPAGPPKQSVAEIAALRRAGAPVSVAQTYLHYLPCGDDRRGETAQVAGLHAAGVAVTTYVNPMVCTSYRAAFEPALEQRALTRDPSGSPAIYRYTGSRTFTVGQYDFFSAAGRRAFAQVLRLPLADGHDGWMEDFGEYTPLSSRSGPGAGIPGSEAHNAYPTAYHCAAWHAVRGLARPIVRFQRSGWTGAARCAQVVWSGDPTTSWGFDGLASQVRAGISMGLSGVSLWGSDIGGYFSLFGPRLTPELLARWVQFGAASGVMRTERSGLAVPAQPRPQVDDAAELANWRRWTRLRTQLYPYLVAAEADYQHTGMPIMRHLSLLWPGGADVRGSDDTFGFGPDFLAAPVLVAGARSRTLPVPPGQWIDLWRSARWDQRAGTLRLGRPRLVRGPGVLTLPAPLDELPLLIRAGAIIPLLPADVQTLAPFGHGVVRLGDRLNRMTLIPFPRGSSSSRMLHGEGLTSVEAPRVWTLLINGSRVRTYTVIASLRTLRHPFAPCTIRTDGHLAPHRSWRYDSRTGALQLTLRGLHMNLRVESC